MNINIFSSGCQGSCTPKAIGVEYICTCDANQIPFIAPPYDQCPVGCFDYYTYCVCSLPPTTNTTRPPPTLPACYYPCRYEYNYHGRRYCSCSSTATLPSGNLLVKYYTVRIN